MHVVSPGRGDVSQGYRGYLTLARAIPFMWPLVLIGLLPPVASMGERLYRHVARSRLRDGPCTDGTCAVHGKPKERVSTLPISPSVGQASGTTLGPAQLIVIGCVCLLQLTASVLRVEIQPWMSDYPMYAGTYSSTQEFDERNPVKRIYRFRHDPDVGPPEDISKTMDDIPEADVVVMQAVSTLVETGRLSPEQMDRVRAIAGQFQSQMDRPLDRVTLLVDEEAFDWRRGRFYWKKVGAPVGTLDTDTLKLAKTAE